MSWWMVISGAIALLLVLMAIGMPLFAAFLVMNVAGVLILFGPAGFGLFANSIYTTATTGTLTAVPLFIAMGEIMFRSGAMEVLFDSMDRLVGRFRGRQYVVCILLSAILGALSGARFFPPCGDGDTTRSSRPERCLPARASTRSSRPASWRF
jgi:TRAP-type mannitol/chloroaromatic compound transport system permease large subunit